MQILPHESHLNHVNAHVWHKEESDSPKSCNLADKMTFGEMDQLVGFVHGILHLHDKVILKHPSELDLQQF